MADTILIAGPGAIGLLHAIRLRAAGFDVILLDHRPDRAARLQHVTLAGHPQDQTMEIAATADPSVAARCQHILICVKAYATPTLAAHLAPHVGTTTTVLSLQNGLGNQAALAPLRCQPNLRLAVTSYGARLQSENTVCLTGSGTTQIAAPPADPIARQWQQLLQTAGFVVTLTQDLDAMLWQKLVLNAAINPVTAHFGLRNGQLPQHPRAWAQACAILDEAICIAQSCGIALDAATQHRRLREICRNTADNDSSMRVDLLSGRKTEIDQINGALVQAAMTQGLPTPHNRRIIALIHSAQAS